MCANRNKIIISIQHSLDSLLIIPLLFDSLLMIHQFLLQDLVKESLFPLFFAKDPLIVGKMFWLNIPRFLILC
jgi:hypothetical protein